jgi:hypothetical protein
VKAIITGLAAVCPKCQMVMAIVESTPIPLKYRRIGCVNEKCSEYMTLYKQPTIELESAQ